MREIVCSLGLIAIFIAACNGKPVKEKVVYVPVNDSSDTTCVQRIVAANHRTELVKDSMQLIIDELKSNNDSLNKNLFVANYKLQRIKRYVEIVDDKPSQVKYLKGWIKRVIKDIK